MVAVVHVAQQSTTLTIRMMIQMMMMIQVIISMTLEEADIRYYCSCCTGGCSHECVSQHYQQRGIQKYQHQ